MEPHFFAEMHSSEGAAGGGGWGEESRRARASGERQRAGGFSKKVRAKDIISPLCIEFKNEIAREDLRVTCYINLLVTLELKYNPRIMKWLNIDINNKKYYGRLTIIGLVLAGVRGILQIELPIIISVAVDIFILAGIISGIIWIIKSYKKHSVEYNKKRDADWQK